MTEQQNKIMEILEEHEARIKRLEKLLEYKPEGLKKDVSVKEFIILKKPKKDVEKTIAVGYYLEKHQGLSSFNINNIKEEFRKAKEPLPSNINQTINANIKKGYMMVTESKKDKLKAWILTNSGEKFVENDFKKEE